MEQLEFMSPAWIEMTRSFLAAAVAKLPATAHGLHYAYCASLSNPPKDLDDGSGKVAYWFSINVPQVEVGSGERADLGPINRADYQASRQETRTTANFSDPKFIAHREAVQQAEKQAGKSVPPSPPTPILTLLGELHNYRAARTA